MTAKTATVKIPQTKRLHLVQPGIMLSKDNTYRASKYANGQWQLEGPDGWKAVAGSTREAKRLVRAHQLPKPKATKRAKKA